MTEEWAAAMHLRGVRHHQDGRGTPPGVLGIPDIDLIGLNFGSDISFLGANGVVDSGEEAANRLQTADHVASAAVEAISVGLEPFREKWLRALGSLGDPELNPWVTPPHEPPPDSGNGRNFPYLVAVDLKDAEAARVLRCQRNIQKLWPKEEPTTCILRMWETSYVDAEANAIKLLTELGIEPKRVGPARAW